ncbi:MAG: MFS transporter, partial [Chloroflexi bacterium]|nr:MFS transporter [Chloroflexota bacterium]
MTPRQRWTLVATIIGSGAVFLDGTVVNVALPRIGRDLPSSIFGVLEGQTYVVSGYLAVLAALLILAGALSDHFGRRRVYAIGLASFAATSALCGLAPTLEWLVVFRLLQGAAGALLVPGALSIITQTFEVGTERGRAFGIWAAATSGLGLLGPLVGGLLVDTIGWRVAFLINVPVLAFALWVVLRHVAESRDEAARRFDWLGSIVAALAVGGLSFGLIRGSERDWQDTISWVAIAVGLLAVIAFPILMARRRDPLVPLSLFRARAFATINLATFCIYGALYVTFSFQGILLQNVLGYTALAAGAVGIPVGICLMLLSTRIGAAAGRIGARPFLVAGPLLMAAGLLWFARLPVDSDPWLAAVTDPATFVPPVDVLIDILPSILLFGFGISCVVAPLTNTLMGSIPERLSGLGSAINNAIARVGQPLIGAVIFIAISSTFYATLGRLAPELDVHSAPVRSAFSPLNPPQASASPDQVAAAKHASIDAFHQSMLVGAGLLAIGAAVSWYGLRGENSARSVAGEATR